MSTIWTPSGERPVGKGGSGPAARPEATPEGEGPGAGLEDELSEEQMAEQMAEAQARIRATPASSIIANHCVGLIQLAVIHLSDESPDLGEAKLAIDALAGLVEAVGDRMGSEAGGLDDVLTQLRIRYVEVRKATTGT